MIKNGVTSKYSSSKGHHWLPIYDGSDYNCMSLLLTPLLDYMLLIISVSNCHLYPKESSDDLYSNIDSNIVEKCLPYICLASLCQIFISNWSVIKKSFLRNFENNEKIAKFYRKSQ
jgi:hypothetical protein